MAGQLAVLTLHNCIHKFLSMQGVKVGIAFAISLGFSVLVIVGLVSNHSSTCSPVPFPDHTHLI